MKKALPLIIFLMAGITNQTIVPTAASVYYNPSSAHLQLFVDGSSNDSQPFHFEISGAANRTQKDGLLFTVWQPDYPRDQNSLRFAGFFNINGIQFDESGIARFPGDVINGTASEVISVSAALPTDGYATRGNYTTTMHVRVDSIGFGALDTVLMIEVTVNPSIVRAYGFSFLGIAINVSATYLLYRKRGKSLDKSYALGPIGGFLANVATIYSGLTTQYPLFGTNAYLDVLLGITYGFTITALFDKFADLVGSAQTKNE